jgi:HD superfamily phosphohydrolase
VRGGDDPVDLVVDYGRGLNALSQFLVGRSYMYAQVYYHKTVRAAEWMFTRVMERFAALARAGDAPPGLEAAARLARGEPVSVEEYLRLDDVRVWCALEDWGDRARDATLADLSRRLTRRRLFKALDLGDDPARAAALRPALAAAAERLLGERSQSYWALDAAQNEVVGPGEELYVVGHPRRGTIDLAQLGAELAPGRPIVSVRVLCAPELLDTFRPLCAGA